MAALSEVRHSWQQPGHAESFCSCRACSAMPQKLLSATGELPCITMLCPQYLPNNAQSRHTPSNVGGQCRQFCAVLCSPPQDAADSLCCVAQPSRLNQLWLGDRSQFKYSSRQPVRRRRGDVHGDLSNVVLNFHWAGEWPDTSASGCVWQAQQPVKTLPHHAGHVMWPVFGAFVDHE